LLSRIGPLRRSRLNNNASGSIEAGKRRRVR
jgi:hypothetical protein